MTPTLARQVAVAVVTAIKHIPNFCHAHPGRRSPRHPAQPRPRLRGEARRRDRRTRQPRAGSPARLPGRAPGRRGRRPSPSGAARSEQSSHPVTSRRVRRRPDRLHLARAGERRPRTAHPPKAEPPMTKAGPVLLIRNEYELQDLIEAEGRDGTLIERDFALTMIAAGLLNRSLRSRGSEGVRWLAGTTSSGGRPSSRTSRPVTSGLSCGGCDARTGG
jgi:hypothetical protein